MGAANALAAYVRFAGKVPPLSMQLLVYMALVSRDHDEQPWFGLGHKALAIHAMNRPDPDDADLRAVRRAISPLLQKEAIIADRAANGRRNEHPTVRYLLLLDPTVGRNSSCGQPDDEGCGQVVELAARRTKTVLPPNVKTIPP
ncbi:hypothetical protein GCM10027258_63000 [Amycolatopsis stemonae]